MTMLGKDICDALYARSCTCRWWCDLLSLADFEHIKAKYDSGTLCLEVPKKEEKQPKQISVE